jgi:ankyrin repeat protein
MSAGSQLLDAIKQDDAQQIHHLIDGGLDPKAAVGRKIPLRTAISYGCPKAAKALIYRGAAAIKEDQLHVGVKFGDVDLIHKALDEGANITGPLRWDDRRMRPLEVACRENKKASVKALIQRGAPPDAPALHIAAQYSPGSVPLLLEAGAAVDAEDSTGSRPLSYACSGGHEGVVRRLLELGADPNAVDEFGDTALMETCYSLKFNQSLLKTLLAHPDIKPTMKNHLGEDALRESCYCGNATAINALLDTGAFDISNNGDKNDRLAQLLEGWVMEASEEDLIGTGDFTEEEAERRRSQQPAYCEAAVALIEAGVRTQKHVCPDISGECLLTGALKPFISRLGDSDLPIPPYRRTLRCLLTMPEEVETMSFSMEIVDDDTDAIEGRRVRLESLRENAWKRRRHLCLDRALWRKPASEPKKARGSETQAKAGAGE